MRLKHFNVSFGEQVFKAMSDASRIRILYLLLRNKELCIADMEMVLDFTQTKTSRHLIYLKNAGLVSFRKQDQWAFYAIKDEMLDLLQQMFAYLEKDAQLLKDQEVYLTLYSNRELAINRLQQRHFTGL
ncbi:metalloregulator ArsR/SmtB family transcription factor [Nibribacter ruber]|uniref:Metalloregulator ArsR/SmtB family transcription factor n=1 Tax=Nibribacter ruber TaxID=2698458 RepID=A0A6P1NYW5_9BACT|nr:metalloregulator ArsR/SmtB family transcription factor [Nibribacter ruber]QHL87614.1 metalloregulator ArsR/SmtB family transcription factor [Nibribacter ruber]